MFSRDIIPNKFSLCLRRENKRAFDTSSVINMPTFTVGSRVASENLSAEHKNGKDHKQSDKPQSVFKEMSDSGEGEANLALGDNLVIRSTSSYFPGVMGYQLFKANSLEVNPPGAHQHKLLPDVKRTESFRKCFFTGHFSRVRMRQTFTT